MARQPLNPDETAAFANIAEFNSTRGKREFTLRDRETSGLNLRGIALVGATFENVLLDRAALARADVRFSRFVRCQFPGADLDRGTYENVEFAGCTFESCQVDAAVFRACTFNACTFQNCKFAACSLADSKLTGCSFGECGFSECELARVAFAQSKFGICEFRRCDLSGCSFAEGQFRKSRIIQPRGMNCSFSGGELVRSGIEDAVYFRGLAFRRAKVQGLTLSSVTCEGVDFEELPELVGLKIRQCSLKALKLSKCKDVIEPCFIESKVEGFAATECEFLCPRFADSRFDHGVAFERSTFDGCDLSAATMAGATITACTFDNGLNVTDAVFTGLKLPGVTYAAGYRPSMGRAKYVESEKFKGTA